MKIILVLGSPNSATGVLSLMAMSRLQVCRHLYVVEPRKIVLTGGYGAHFNTSDKPHAYYLREALLNANVPSNDILALVESRHSVEDATLSKWIIDKYSPEEITIVTSDYHVARAKVIFDAVYAPFKRFTFVPAPSAHIDRSIINPLVQHEQVALQDLLDNGVRF
jgi:uncharacterized SAM-binding protein YcdF (DUF218 family)